MLHKRGEEHGTITCRIDDAENFEITTLRCKKGVFRLLNMPFGVSSCFLEEFPVAGL